MSKKTAKKSVAKKTVAKKSAVKKAIAKKPPSKKAAAKPAAKKASARIAAKKLSAKKSVSAKKTTAKAATQKVPVRKTAPSKKAPAKATRKSASKATRGKAPPSRPKKEISPAKAAVEATASDEKGTPAMSEIEIRPPSAGFTLDDVRSVLVTKKEENLKDKSAAGTKTKPKAKTKPKPKPAKRTSIKKKAAAASVTDILGFNPAKSSTSPDRDESKVPPKWKPLFRSLLQFRLHLKEALGERTEETIGASARESSGELSVNSPDAGSESFDRDIALSMVAGEQETLQEVEAAIDRIFDGTYGICQETGKPIKKTRLKAVPFTRFSLDGQAQFEQRGSQERDKGGGVFATLSEASLGDDQA